MSISAVVADDSKVMLDQIVPILTRLGVKVIAAFDDGEKAWDFIKAEAARNCAPDLAVLDYVMPNKTGAEVALLIRDAGLPTKVLMWTSMGQEGAAKEGVHETRVKPYSVALTKLSLQSMGLL